MGFPQRRLALWLWRALAECRPPSEFLTCFSDVPADRTPEVLAVTPGVDSSLALPEHGPCLVDGIITLGNDASFTSKITVNSGANTVAPYG